MFILTEELKNTDQIRYAKRRYIWLISVKKNYQTD